MKQYLLTVYQPDGPVPDAEVMDGIGRELDALNQDIKDAGAWVFAGGLFPPSTATVMRPTDEDVLTTDGPFTEAKEYVGGFTIVKAHDLDGALAWGRRLARATHLPIEVRPFMDEAED